MVTTQPCVYHRFRQVNPAFWYTKLLSKFGLIFWSKSTHKHIFADLLGSVSFNIN
jgi:hypothetical protein